MSVLYRETSWWYWLASDLLLIAGLGFALAIALSLIQIAHFSLREGSFAAFPVQVRLGYAAVLIGAAWAPIHWLYWLPACGTAAVVLFGYCLLARFLSLMPWNRRSPFSWTLVRRTFLTPPVRGNILHGLPAST